MRRFRRAHRPRGLIRDVSFTGNHDALTARICSRSADLVRSPVGRLRNYHPATHCDAEETSVRQVLQVELATLGRRGTQDSRSQFPFELRRCLWPDLDRALARAMGWADDRRFRADLSQSGAAIPGGFWSGWLRYLALHERLHFPDARDG